MKAKLIFVLLALPLLSLCQEIHYGMSVGVNFSKWSGDDESFAQELVDEMNSEDGFVGFSFSPEMSPGFNIGFFLEYPVKKSLTIQPEISYTQKGAKFSGSGRYEYYSDTYSTQMDMIYKSDYIDLALLAKYYLSKGNTKPYVLVGPGAGYLVSTSLKVNVTVEGESNSESSDIDMEQKFDANFNFGGGIDFSNQIRLEFRYSRGLISIFNDNSEDALKNSVTSINLIACF